MFSLPVFTASCKYISLLSCSACPLLVRLFSLLIRCSDFFVVMNLDIFTASVNSFSSGSSKFLLPIYDPPPLPLTLMTSIPNSCKTLISSLTVLMFASMLQLSKYLNISSADRICSSSLSLIKNSMTLSILSLLLIAFNLPEDFLSYCILMMSFSILSYHFNPLNQNLFIVNSQDFLIASSVYNPRLLCLALYTSVVALPFSHSYLQCCPLFRNR